MMDNTTILEMDEEDKKDDNKVRLCISCSYPLDDDEIFICEPCKNIERDDWF